MYTYAYSRKCVFLIDYCFFKSTSLALYCQLTLQQGTFWWDNLLFQYFFLTSSHWLVLLLIVYFRIMCISQVVFCILFVTWRNIVYIVIYFIYLYTLFKYFSMLLKEKKKRWATYSFHFVLGFRCALSLYYTLIL